MIKPTIIVNINQQILFLKKNQCIQTYPISTAKAGPGEIFGSGQTPRGRHVIRAKIGSGCAINTVFVGRRPTGEIYSSELAKRYPSRDWILTRILWLSGLEVGKNRLGNVDTMRRFIYIHGTPESKPMGVPSSKGCICMHNSDLIELYEQLPPFTEVIIE